MKKITKIVLGLALITGLTTSVIVHKGVSAKKEAIGGTKTFYVLDPGGGRP